VQGSPVDSVVEKQPALCQADSLQQQMGSNEPCALRIQAKSVHDAGKWRLVKRVYKVAVKRFALVLKAFCANIESLGWRSKAFVCNG
jgi:hypothetical protein